MREGCGNIYNHALGPDDGCARGVRHSDEALVTRISCAPATPRRVYTVCGYDEMVDVSDLGSGGETRGGSSPSIRTQTYTYTGLGVRFSTHTSSVSLKGVCSSMAEH